MVNSPTVVLPVTAIGLSLASVGLKIYGGKGALMELLTQPIDFATHILAGEIESRKKISERDRAVN